ncbi:MAG TPA: hypothetical protein DEF51_04615 [Myxococcales bacterium]|nr:hypothetical protein [Myxococcales bacterium]
MGAQPYMYVVDYEEPLQAALDELRAREFEAGRYCPVLMFPQDDPNATPGRGHDTIAEAFAAAGADGTNSILDIAKIADAPDYCAAAPFDDEALVAFFGGTRPEASTFDAWPCGEAFDEISRGMARYVVGYSEGRPSKILFIGYSFD